MPDPILLGLGLLLMLVTGLALLLPVWAGAQTGDGRREGALRIFEDQLAEIDRDRARGLIAAEDASAARVEIQRRMIAADREADVPAIRGGRRSLAALIACAIAAPLAGLGVYWAISDPMARSGALAREAAERADIVGLAVQLKARLEGDPGESPTEGWLILARTYSGLGEPHAAIGAYERVLERADMPADALARYAELVMRQGDAATWPKAVAALDRAITMSMASGPADARAVYYRALAHDQAGETAAALSLLDTRLGASDAPQALATLRARIAGDAGPGMPAPDAAAIAAAEAMTAEEQGAFIRSMVDGLAARLQAEPNDLDGWLRLARAYQVLGEIGAARGALEAAEPLAAALPENDPRRAIVADGLEALR